MLLLPAGFNNRAAASWRLLLAIAELAGSARSQEARQAAERLTRTVNKPSQRKQLLAAFRDIFATGCREITSAALVERLNSDPTGVWCEFNHGGNITQRQVAHLLDAVDIHPVPLDPTRRKDFARRGYKLAQFTDAFERFLPGHPIIRSSPVVKPAMRKAKRTAKK